MEREEELLRQALITTAVIAQKSYELMDIGLKLNSTNGAINLSLLASATPLEQFSEIAMRLLAPAIQARLGEISNNYIPRSLQEAVIQDEVDRLLRSLQENENDTKS